MQWIVIAIFSYLFGAVAIVLDKYLLGSKRIRSAPVYAFYIGLLGLGVLLFAPLVIYFPSLQLSLPSNDLLGLSVFSGMIYMAGIATLYFAIERAEASRVTPVVFSLIPIITFIGASASKNENLSQLEIIGVILLVLGGLFISFDLPLKINKRKFFSGFYLACLSGVLLGGSYVIFKVIYGNLSFYNGFVWTRIGAFLAIFLLLFIPNWRRDIFLSMKPSKNKGKENARTGSLFIFNKILGGSSSILLNKAIQMGSVTAVNAMVSLQYVFVLVLAGLASRKNGKIFGEKMNTWDWAQKIVAILIIGTGMYLIF